MLYTSARLPNPSFFAKGLHRFWANPIGERALIHNKTGGDYILLDRDRAFSWVWRSTETKIKNLFRLNSEKFS
ncbi:MAG TPA: hypothetical protein V6D28_31735 [Leptolyngbyaceae cyanobacterium]